MELIDSLTFSRVSRVLKAPQEVLFEDACEEILSLAVRVHSTAPKLYENSVSGVGDAENFNYSGNYRYVYLYGNFLANHKDMILSSGEIPLADIINFNKYPIGHPKREANESMYSLNVYEGKSTPYKKWQYEYMWQRLNIVTNLYVTRDAILHSPQYKHLIGNIDNSPIINECKNDDKSLKSVGELVSWSGNGQAQSLVTSCWQAFTNNNSHYPLTVGELLKYASSHIGLKIEKGEYKGDDRIILSGSGCKWTSFKRLANELIKHAKILKT